MSRNPFVVLGAVLAGLLIAAGALFFVVGGDGVDGGIADDSEILPADEELRTVRDARRFIVEEGTLGSAADGAEPDAGVAGAWAVFSAVAGDDAEHIAVFAVYHDPDDPAAASVSRNDHDDAFWDLAVNTAWNDDASELVHTMIHEYGHILTLSADQISPVAEVCSTFESDEGCAHPNSVIAGFESRFWERYGGDVTHGAGVEAADDAAGAEFFDSHGGFDTFVSEYAATDVIEDVAESWADYVLSDTPGLSYRDATGTAEWSQKVRFFDGFPPFAAQRERIREAIGVG